VAKPIGPGSEVDAFCTRCKLDLMHKIVAMEGGKIARVECISCKGQHTYRRPKSAEPAERASKSRSPRSTPAPRSSSGPRGAQLLRKRWEEAILGRSPTDFSAYRIDQQFQEGQLVRHSKFGEGVVARIIDAGKVEILFEAGAKTLAQGRPS
jgi:hypothetical protein